MLEAAGFDRDKDVKRERLGAAESTNALKDKKIDAYFWVNDADALHGEFVDAGADVVCGPEEQVYGMREFLVRDPDGHVLAFGHDTTGAA